MVKRVTTSTALDRLKKTYQRKAGQWVLQQLGYEQADSLIASFPMHPPTQNQARQDQQAAIDWVESWRTQPKLADYVIWESRQWSLLGRQEVPLRLEIADPAALAAVIGKTAHWHTLLQRFSSILAALNSDSEQLLTILARNVDGISALDAVDFQRLGAANK